jgi:two-component system cell cycle response regulator
VSASETPPPDRTPGLPRLTRRAFTDLGLWMLVLGIIIGLAFPFVLPAFGMPRALTLRPVFFAVTVLAGLLLAGANYGLARWVVGTRVRALSRQMHHVGQGISEATFTGDWSHSSPEHSQLRVDSDDELGEVAASFNSLIGALAGSRAVQQAMTGHARTLAEHLELAPFASSALRSFLSVGRADAGALCVTRDGETEVAAVHRLSAAGLGGNVTVAAALAGTDPIWMDLPDGVEVDAGLLSFRPTTVLHLPLAFRSTALGVLVLAFAHSPAPETVRLLDALAAPTAVALNNPLAHERFQRLAAIDSLTGVYNRRFGLKRLDEEWARAIRAGTPLGVLTFDIDHFKAVNDTYGHLCGDRVLRDTAAAARLVMRDGDVLIRTGGEEFLIVLPGAGGEDVRSVGERIRRAVASNVLPVGHSTLSVTISLGGATIHGSKSDTAEQLTELADQAMYLSKNSGRDRLTMA